MLLGGAAIALAASDAWSAATGSLENYGEKTTQWIEYWLRSKGILTDIPNPFADQSDQVAALLAQVNGLAATSGPLGAFTRSIATSTRFTQEQQQALLPLVGGLQQLRATLTATDRSTIATYVEAGNYIGVLGVLERNLLEAKRAEEQVTRAHGKAGDAASSAEARHRGFEESVRRAGDEAGRTGGKVDGMRGSLEKIARDWNVKVNADTTQAQAAIYAVRSALGLIDTSVTIAINAVGNAVGEVIGAEHGAFIPGAARGGFVRRPQLLQVGEKSKSEMILPLEDKRGHKALVGALVEALETVGAGRQGTGADRARLEIQGFHRANLRFQQDTDWSYAQWGW